MSHVSGKEHVGNSYQRLHSLLRVSAAAAAANVVAAAAVQQVAAAGYHHEQCFAGQATNITCHLAKSPWAAPCIQKAKWGQTQACCVALSGCHSSIAGLVAYP